MAWTGLVLTADGRTALNQAQLSKKLNFKSIVVGDGQPPNNFGMQKGLVNQLYEITDLKIDATDTGCMLTADFPKVDYDYYYREIGIIVTTEDEDKLYVYDNCGEDAQYIISTTGAEEVKRRIRLSLKISDVEEITVSTPAILYVAYDDFESTVKVLNEHLENKNNPHNVTKEDIGLENVDNTSDKDKPISEATQKALDELKNSVSDGKTKVANAITDKGVTTATNASFDTMASNITQMGTNQYNSGYSAGESDGYSEGNSAGYTTGYSAGVSATKKGTAVASDVLTGKTFTNSSGVAIAGTMPNLDNKAITLTSADKRTILNQPTALNAIWRVANSDGIIRTCFQIPKQGYVPSGASVIVGVIDSILASVIGVVASKIAKGQSILGVNGSYTSDGTAVASEILNGKTAYVNGNKVTGNMPDLTANSNVVHATGNATKVVLGDEAFVSTNTDGVQRAEIRYNGNAGRISGNTLFGVPLAKMANAIGLTAAKLLQGQSACGVSGTATSDANAGAGQILAGYSGYIKGNKINGTMANQGAKTASLNCGGSYAIPAGYHNGSGKVTANSLASQTSATATAADIASGKTAYVNGVKVTGSAIIVPP